MSSPLLLTGAGRSGTTLVEKLLHTHPEIGIGSQPFPDLFIEAKRAFLAERGVDRENPVGPRFPEPDGGLDELADFLERDHWSAARLDALFAALAANSGQNMKPVLAARNAIEPGSFFDVYAQLLAVVGAELGCEQARWVGSKEIFLEEFGAILLDRGGAMVVVVRDPRDMLTSFRYGRGRAYGGEIRPTLYLLRQWRKSVAFALHLRNRERFAAVRYEDVAANPVTSLNDVAERLAVEPSFASFDGSVPDQNGAAWAGNSSFDPHDGLSRDSIGRWRQLLDLPTVRFVETVCGPEMAALGYDADRSDPAAIGEFVEPSFVGHRRFPSDYSTNTDAVEIEQRRLALLRASRPAAAIREHYFIFPEVYDLLRGEGPPEQRRGRP